MITEIHAKQILERALAASPAKRTVAYLMGGKEALTRFAENVVHQNVLKKDYFLKVVVEHEGKVGMATSNIFDPENVKRTVESAIDVAKMQTRLSKLHFNDKVVDYPRVALYDEATIEMSPIERARKVAEIIDLAKAKKYKASGAFAVSDWITAIASNTGFYGYHTETTANLTVTVMDDAGLAGFGEQAGHKASEIDHRAVGERAVRKVDASRKTYRLGPGRYDVVLEHSAVVSPAMFLIYLGMSAQDVHEGTSFMGGKIGQKITGENFTLIDDATFEGTPGRAFDYQGVARRRARSRRGSRAPTPTTSRRREGPRVHRPQLYGPMPFSPHRARRFQPREMVKSTKRAST
jgi:predicted Zn-dependent protease